MRTVKDTALIKTTKNRSANGVEQLVLQSRRKREFFKFENKELIEYDCTKYKYKQVVLTNEEKDVANSFHPVCRD